MLNKLKEIYSETQDELEKNYKQYTVVRNSNFLHILLTLHIFVTYGKSISKV